MPEPPGVPKLSQLAANKVLLLSSQLVGIDFGLVPFHLMKPILARLNAKQLSHVEETNPHLQPDLDVLWAALVAKDFPQRPSRLGKLHPQSSKETYLTYVRERDSFREDSAQKLRRINEKIQREKLAKKIVEVERLREPFIRRRAYTGGNPRTYSPVIGDRNSIMNKARKDLMNRPKMKKYDAYSAFKSPVERLERDRPIRRTQFNVSHSSSQGGRIVHGPMITRESGNGRTTERSNNQGSVRSLNTTRAQSHTANLPTRAQSQTTSLSTTSAQSQTTSLSTTRAQSQTTNLPSTRVPTTNLPSNRVPTTNLSTTNQQHGDSGSLQGNPNQTSGIVDVTDSTATEGTHSSPIVVNNRLPKKEPSIFLVRPRKRPRQPPKKAEIKEPPMPSGIKRIKSSVFS